MHGIAINLFFVYTLLTFPPPSIPYQYIALFHTGSDERRKKVLIKIHKEEKEYPQKKKKKEKHPKQTPHEKEIEYILHHRPT